MLINKHMCHKNHNTLCIEYISVRHNYLRGTLELNASFKVLCKSLVAHWLQLRDCLSELLCVNAKIQM